MQFRSLLAVAAGLAFVAAKPVDHEAQYVQDTKDFWKRQDPVKACATGIHLIAISGDGIANKGSTGDLNVTYAALKDAIPGSTHRNLPYPKGSPNNLAKTIVGASNLKRWVDEYINACPSSKIVIVGYSAGGIIGMNTLCGASSYPWPSTDPLPSRYNKHIIATIIYGDETFVGNQPYDVGSCAGQGPFPRTNLAGCDAFAAGIRSYCVAEDPQCCLGDNGSAHFIYATKYEQNSIDWVKHRYAVTPNP